MFQLTQNMLDGLPRNGPTDPIEYYRRPWVGWLFRERINRGLRLLPTKRFSRALEVGYGAGAVQLALAEGVSELHGIDLDADAKQVTQLLLHRQCRPLLRQGNVLALPYDDRFFDLVVSFSVFEHLEAYDRALSEVVRVLSPGGMFLLGMPAVNKLMEAGFYAIGFRGINDHHVTTPQQVAAKAKELGLRIVGHHPLDFPASRPLGLRLYYNWLFQAPE